jgi:hypothetical protein
MKVYQISYDLRKKRDYTSLYKRVLSYKTFYHALESSWIIVTDQTATQILDFLAQATDTDDRLLVARLQGEAAWRDLGDELSQWLKNQLTPRFA